MSFEAEIRSLPFPSLSFPNPTFRRPRPFSEVTTQPSQVGMRALGALNGLVAAGRSSRDWSFVRAELIPRGRRARSGVLERLIVDHPFLTTHSSALKKSSVVFLGVGVLFFLVQYLCKNLSSTTRIRAVNRIPTLASSRRLYFRLFN